MADAGPETGAIWPQVTEKVTIPRGTYRELADRRRRVGRLPNPVDAFLQTHWQQYLIDCLQRHGVDGSPWRQALATVDALLWSLSPKEGAASQRLAELRPRMIRRLRQGMDQIGVSMFEQEAFLEVLDDILDRAQAGQPVWDWREESEIEALLGPEDLPQPPADSVTVVEIAPPSDAGVAGKAANQDAAEAPAPGMPVDPTQTATCVDDDQDEEIVIESEAPGHEQVGYEEEVVDVDDLADELDEVVLLNLPGTDDEPGDEAQVEVIEPETEAEPPFESESEAQSEPPAEPDAEPVSESQASAAEAADEGQDQASAADEGNSLEALLRRRGLSIAAHVEEVEVTERGSRG